MIRKGRSINERFVLKKRNGAISVDGASAARFGYKLGADDGVWVDWLWDRGRFELSTGPLGFYPVFYHADRHGFGVSNDVTRLLAAGCSPELDATVRAEDAAGEVDVGKPRLPFGHLRDPAIGMDVELELQPTPGVRVLGELGDVASLHRRP